MKDKFNKIVVLNGKLTDPENLGLEAMLSEVAAEVRFYPTTEPGQAKRRCKGADAIVVGTGTLDPEHITCLSKEGLRLIIAASTGYDYLNGCLDKAHELGISVCNVPDYSNEAVADYVVSELQLTLYRANGLGNGWRDTGAEIAGTVRRRYSSLTLGIIGLGRIGTKVAQLAAERGISNIIAYSPHWKDKVLPPGIKIDFKKSVQEVAEKCDVLTLHCALNADTYHLISADMIRRMKNGAILINTARRDVVFEEALVEALLTNKLKAAIVDVAAKNSKLVNVRNARITDHMAYADDVSLEQLLKGVVANAKAFLSGKPINLVYPTPRYGTPQLKGIGTAFSNMGQCAR